MVPGLEWLLREGGFKVELAKIGTGRMVETGDDEFGWTVLQIGGNRRGGIFLWESTIQLGKEVGSVDGIVSAPGDFPFSFASNAKILLINYIVT